MDWEWFKMRLVEVWIHVCEILLALFIANIVLG